MRFSLILLFSNFLLIFPTNYFSTLYVCLLGFYFSFQIPVIILCCIFRLLCHPSRRGLMFGSSFTLRHLVGQSPSARVQACHALHQLNLHIHCNASRLKPISFVFLVGVVI